MLYQGKLKSIKAPFLNPWITKRYYDLLQGIKLEA